MKQTFEQAMERLKAISLALENESLPLEEALSLYAEGAALTNELNQCLADAQEKIDHDPEEA